jgi:ubiquinone/menaquinone biosynthesis C-methylase UbiE
MKPFCSLALKVMRRPASQRALLSSWLDEVDNNGGVDMSGVDKLLRTRPALHEQTEESDDDEFLNTGDPDPRYRLGKLLLKVARVAYRKPEHMPGWLQEKEKEIAQHRTTHQVRRCLKDWMLSADRLRQREFFNRRLYWSKHVDTSKKTALRAYGADETIAYCRYFLPGRFSVLRRILREVQMIMPDFVPHRVVDFGCGPAVGAAACFDVWGKGSVKKYAGIDLSTSMLDAAKMVTSGLDIECQYWQRTSDIVKRVISDDNERFDMAICSYTLTELNNDPARRAAVQILFEMLDVGGIVVFLDRGNPEGSFSVRTARQFLIDMHDPSHFTGKKSKFASMKGDQSAEELDRPQYVLRSAPGVTHAETGAFTLAPCTHDRPCPLSADIYCSFSQKVFGSVIRDDQAEKFSYVTMQKRKRAVLVKDISKEGAMPPLPLDVYLAEKKQHKGPSDRDKIKVEVQISSKKSGGYWLDVDESNYVARMASEKKDAFPTTLTIFKRFQELGAAADDIVEEPEEPITLTEKDDIEFGLSSSEQLKKTQERREQLAREAEEAGEAWYDRDSESEDEDEKAVVRTKADALVDQLLDEVSTSHVLSIDIYLDVKSIVMVFIVD